MEEGRQESGLYNARYSIMAKFIKILRYSKQQLTTFTIKSQNVKACVSLE